MTPWDGHIRLQIVDGILCYFDRNGDTILVYEEDEDEWAEWE